MKRAAELLLEWKEKNPGKNFLRIFWLIFFTEQQETVVSSLIEDEEDDSLTLYH